MAQKTSSRLSKGRPAKQDSLWYRSEVFKILFARWENLDADPVLKYSDVAADLHIGIKTIRTIVKEISDASTSMVLVPRGIRVRRETYYHNSLTKARGIKDDLADEFVKRIPPDVTLASCAGTTVALSLKRLIEEGHYHVIVTNSIGALDQLGGSDIANLVFTGGEYKPGIHGCVGSKAVEAFKEARCQAALIGISGINDKGDLFVRHSEEIPVYNQILRSVTDYVFIVADARKLAQVDTWCFNNIRQLLEDEQRPNLKVCLITNSYQSLEDEHSRDRAKIVCKSLKSIRDENNRLDVVIVKKTTDKERTHI